MGFETAIPPVPDRLQEIKGMERLQKNWEDQRFYKYYMNESLRIPKMAFADRLNKCYSEMYFKIAISGILLLPLVFLSRRYFINQGGVPATKQADTFNKRRSDTYLVSFRQLKMVLPIYLASTIAAGMLWTDWSPAKDIYHDYTHKTPKMI